MNQQTNGPTVHDASIWLENLQRRASGRQSMLRPSSARASDHGQSTSNSGGGFNLAREDHIRYPFRTPPSNHEFLTDREGRSPASKPGVRRSVAAEERGTNRPEAVAQDDHQTFLENATPVGSDADNEYITDKPRGRKRRQKESLEDEEADGLDELAAPRPAQPERSYKHSLDKSRRSGGNQKESLDEEEQDDLDELAAPEPIQQDDSSGRWRRDSHLEDAPRYEDSRQKPGGKPQHLSVATQLYIHCHLIFWSFVGTLVRLGLQWITFYPGAPVVFTVLWANLAGSLLMGFLSEDRKLFMQEWGSTPRDDASSSSFDPKNPRGSDEKRAGHTKVKKTIPLFIGLTVGFCGSTTSFSSFERDIFLALANKLPTPINHPRTTAPVDSFVDRSGGYSFEAMLAVIIVTVAVSVNALRFGAHCAIAMDRFTPTLPFRLARHVLDPIIVVLAMGCWIGAIVMAAVPPDRVGGPAYRGHGETWRGQVVFALVFAPLGALTRFYLSIKLNSLIAWFPLGTFAANIFGTAIEGMTYDLQRAPMEAIGVVGVTACQVLQGVEDGFCGCLSTVSTWVLELTTLERRHAYLYGTTSVVAGLAILIVIQGTVVWTIGYNSPSCATPIA